MSCKAYLLRPSSMVKKGACKKPINALPMAYLYNTYPRLLQILFALLLQYILQESEQPYQEASDLGRELTSYLVP